MKDEFPSGLLSHFGIIDIFAAFEGGKAVNKIFPPMVNGISDINWNSKKWEILWQMFWVYKTYVLFWLLLYLFVQWCKKIQ